jgi:dihydrofolate reductase
MQIAMIAAIGRNRELGAKNTLLWHLPADFAHFKHITMGHPMIMGKNTHLSIGRVLPGRENIILAEPGYTVPGAIVVSSLPEAYAAAQKTGLEKCFVIGGASVYGQAIDGVDTLYLTHVDAVFPGADVFFPEYEDHFTKVSETEPAEDNNLTYTFATYQRTV